jgi:trehalose-phosphatase
MPGVLLEHKPASFAVHYRKAVPSVEKKVKRLIAQACGGPVRREEISLMRGKKVIEIVSPHAMNKGQAARRLLRRWGRKKFLPIFIGDDRTDETAFEVFREGGLTVRVGRTATSSRAGYYVNTVEDVRTLLSTIVCFRGKYS